MKVIRILTCLLLLFGFFIIAINSCCPPFCPSPRPSPEQKAFYMTFAISDHKIQMNKSYDGTVWPDKIVVHDEKKIIKGPSIATNSNKMVALAYITVGSEQHLKDLVVKENYFNPDSWQSGFANLAYMAIDSNSSPAICHIKDRIYAVAYNSNRTIKVTSVKMDNPEDQRFSGSTIIWNSAPITGPPSMAFNGNKILLVWMNGKNTLEWSIHCATGYFQNNQLVWQNQWNGYDQITLNEQPRGSNLYDISLTWNGNNFLLVSSSIMTIAVGDERLTKTKVCVFKPSDGVEWRRFHIHDEPDPLGRFVTIASANNQPTILAICPHGRSADSYGKICTGWNNVFPDQEESCTNWSRTFGHNGKLKTKASLTFRHFGN